MSIKKKQSMPAGIYSLKGWILLVVSLFVMSIGVALSIKANLGTSPISSLPYVMSLITPLTVGNDTILMQDRKSVV